MAKSDLISLEDLMDDTPEHFKTFRSLLFMALLDPADDIREMVITEINKNMENFLRKIYARDQKIYAGITDNLGKLYTVYVADLPQTYQNQPAVPHSFDLDAN